MNYIQKEAIECLSNSNKDRSTLKGFLKEFDSSNQCLLGYKYLFEFELLGIEESKIKAYESWNKHLNNIIETEEIELLKYSDSCFWNLYLGMLTNDSEKQKNHNMNVLKSGEKIIPIMEKTGDFSGELTHRLLISYIDITYDKNIDDNFYHKIEMLAKNKKIKDSLIYEAKGVIGLKYRDNINQINSFLRNSFNNHIIYLHKKRIKELINYANR